MVNSVKRMAPPHPISRPLNVPDPMPPDPPFHMSVCYCRFLAFSKRDRQ